MGDPYGGRCQPALACSLAGLSCGVAEGAGPGASSGPLSHWKPPSRGNHTRRRNRGLWGGQRLRTWTGLVQDPLRKIGRGLGGATHAVSVETAAMGMRVRQPKFKSQLCRSRRPGLGPCVAFACFVVHTVGVTLRPTTQDCCKYWRGSLMFID